MSDLPTGVPGGYGWCWQYTVVRIGMFGANTRLPMALSYFGSRGWELVAVYDKESNFVNGEKGFVLFKKPVPNGVVPDGGWCGVWSAGELEAAYAAQAT